MIELPDLASFTAASSEPRFLGALGASLLAGVVRGFSGFGAALIFVPLVAALYDPITAAGTFMLIDFAMGFAMLPSVWREAHWREVFPLAAAAVVAAQFGALILIYADPTALRWGIVVVVLVLLAILMSGWRYHGQPVLPVTLGVGAVAGFLGGATQIVGPPVIVYWLGSARTVSVVRANLSAFFVLFACVLFVTYAARGLLHSHVVTLALVLGPTQILALYAGTRLFRLASPQTYRHIAYLIVAAAALVSMPLLDQFLR